MPSKRLLLALAIANFKWSILLATFLGPLHVTVFAQESDNKLSVLKFSWERVRIGQPASRSSLASQDELIQESRRQQQLANARNTNSVGAVGRLETEIKTHDQAKAKALENELPRDAYRYKVTLRNDGPLTVKSIDWDYIFLDSMTDQELARHQFTSDDTIKSGKNKEISVLYLKPPVRAINAGTLKDLKGERRFKQRVEIAGIHYSDGSVWQKR